MDHKRLKVESDNIENEATVEADDRLPFARSYQLEALEIAKDHNTIVFLETGTGKTLIAIMLLRSYAYQLRKPSPYIAVFLVPQVVLVDQQAKEVSRHTDLDVEMYWGDKGVDFWDASKWEDEISKHEVLVMTPQILLNALRHGFIKLNLIKVLIVDECHHARGKHPYALIMTEFYHHQLGQGDVPRILGMTASPIKSKGSMSDFWPEIHKLESVMNSKVFTCASESVLAEFVPFSNPIFRFYDHPDIPHEMYKYFDVHLNSVRTKHELSLKQQDLNDSSLQSIMMKLSKRHGILMYCLNELGLLLAYKAAQFLSCCDNDFLFWEKLDIHAERAINSFSLDAFQTFQNYVNTCQVELSIGDDLGSCVWKGLLTTKVVRLIELLRDYRHMKDIRCIVFVERVVTAIVTQSLLNEFLTKDIGWKTEYIAGNTSGLLPQTRKTQNEIVDQFRKGKVNIIVATSILEEGLDVQSCNLVLRFDPSHTVSSFIQSRGRARMKNSDYLLMVSSGDNLTHERLKKYLDSGEKMREESLRHASVPCFPSKRKFCDDEFYFVESTGAIVTLDSSVSLLYLYCSRLPSDGYFKPAPRCVIDEEEGTFTLLLPKSCPIQFVQVKGTDKTAKQKACLEACKQLHSVGALNDQLVPDTLVEEADSQQCNFQYNDEQPMYFAPELVSQGPSEIKTKYYLYLIELNQSFNYDVHVHDMVLFLRSELDSEISSTEFNLEADKGVVNVKLKYMGFLNLERDQALLCRKFQITVFKVLMDRSWDGLSDLMNRQLENKIRTDYFILPSVDSCQIDWKSVTSLLFSYETVWEDHVDCPLGETCRVVPTKSGPVCLCMLLNSLVYTPHNGNLYCITGTLEHLNGNSLLTLRNGQSMSYKKYYENQYGIKLLHVNEVLLRGRHIFPIHNCLHSGRKQKDRESKNASVEIPPEVCSVYMSPISVNTFYSFTFAPSIMHRLESMLIAFNLKKSHLENGMHNVVPTKKILEAITTKRCQESFHLESLETLGDSFLKYAVCQQLFRTYENHHEGLLSLKKDKIISNAALCKFGCDCKLSGYIRDESFDPKKWIIPGDNSCSYFLDGDCDSNMKVIHLKETRKLKRKTIADVIEALIGALVSTGGEKAALSFMHNIGIKMDYHSSPYQRHFSVQAERLVNVNHLQSLLNYKFKDPTLLVEALTHGSYMLPEVPRCYQRLEFLGDSVLDYLVTAYLYNKYPGLLPGSLTDLRSASVNNDVYALAALKAGLNKHILYASRELQKHLFSAVSYFEEVSVTEIVGWESETTLPKVLGDVIESLAGAILVDSGYNKEVVFQSITPLLEPLVTPETVKLHPVRELTELCQRLHFDEKKPVVSHDKGKSYITIEVEANGVIFTHTSSAVDKKTAKRIAAKEVLKVMKATGFGA